MTVLLLLLLQSMDSSEFKASSTVLLRIVAMSVGCRSGSSGPGKAALGSCARRNTVKGAPHQGIKLCSYFM